MNKQIGAVLAAVVLGILRTPGHAVAAPSDRGQVLEELHSLRSLQYLGDQLTVTISDVAGEQTYRTQYVFGAQMRTLTVSEATGGEALRTTARYQDEYEYLPQGYAGNHVLKNMQRWVSPTAQGVRIWNPRIADTAADLDPTGFIQDILDESGADTDWTFDRTVTAGGATTYTITDSENEFADRITTRTLTFGPDGRLLNLVEQEATPLEDGGTDVATTTTSWDYTSPGVALADMGPYVAQSTYEKVIAITAYGTLLNYIASDIADNAAQAGHRATVKGVQRAATDWVGRDQVLRVKNLANGVRVTVFNRFTKYHNDRIITVSRGEVTIARKVRR